VRFPCDLQKEPAAPGNAGRRESRLGSGNLGLLNAACALNPFRLSKRSKRNVLAGVQKNQNPLTLVEWFEFNVRAQLRPEAIVEGTDAPI
jgi:hypothetical protein